MAKKGQEYRKHSPKFKLSVILDMRENHLGLRETARKYKLVHYVVAQWERKYLEEGYKGLMKDKRGRPPKLDKKVEEDLIAENRRLRMENEYLKKLNALVQERIERDNGKKQK